MIQNKEWTDRLAERLSEAEVATPANGWERLEGALSQERRGGVWIWWRRACATAALVALIAGVAWRFIPVEKPAQMPLTSEVVTTPLPLVESVVEIPSERQQIVANDHVVKPVQSVAIVALPKERDEVETQTETFLSKHPEEPSVDASEQPAKTTSDCAVEVRPSSPSSRPHVGVDLMAEGRSVRRVKRGWSLGVMGGSSAGFGSTNVEDLSSFSDYDGIGGYYPPDSLPSIPQKPKELGRAFWPSDYEQADLKHDRPWSFGLTLSRELGRGFSLETGLQYTLLRAEVHYRYGTANQSLHLLGVPLRLQKELFEAGRFGLYVGAGGVAELPLRSKVGDVVVHDRRVQFSLSVVAGARYRIGGAAELYFEPDLGYQLTETRLRTIRTEDPLTLSLRAGLRFRLSNKK